MILIEIDVMDGRGKITACVNTYTDVDRISALCRWAKKQDEALEDLRDVAQEVIEQFDAPPDSYDITQIINKLRAELERKP